MDGVLLIDKAQGPTSHDVVRKLRRILSIPRIGHAGTLDPDATGLLILCIGKATKSSAVLMEGDKRYSVRFLLGRETDTYDSTGTTVAERPVSVTEAEVRAALENFIGPQEQRPPLYSAVKVNGKKLYEYARKGIAVEVPLRKVTIESIRMVSFQSPSGEIEVACSKGTYVRSLMHDIGRCLGTGAVTTAIRRTRSGAFTVEQAVTLDEIEASADPRRRISEALVNR